MNTDGLRRFLIGTLSNDRLLVVVLRARHFESTRFVSSLCTSNEGLRVIGVRFISFSGVRFQDRIRYAALPAPRFGPFWAWCFYLDYADSSNPVRAATAR